MRRLIVAFVGLIPLFVLHAAPSVFAGHRVYEKTFRILDGQNVSLHVTDAGPIPEESPRMRFVEAGQIWERPTNGSPAKYRWSFGIELLNGAKPTKLVIDDVTGKTAITMAEDASPAQEKLGKGFAWFGKQQTDCTIQRDSPCVAMVFRSGAQWFVFRATASFEDGSTEMLYQASEFNPDRMQPIFQQIGIAQ